MCAVSSSCAKLDVRGSLEGSMDFSLDGYAIVSSGLDVSAALVLGVALSGKYYIVVRVDASVSASAWVLGFCGDAMERTSFPANTSSLSASGCGTLWAAACWLTWALMCR